MQIEGCGADILRTCVHVQWIQCGSLLFMDSMWKWMDGWIQCGSLLFMSCMHHYDIVYCMGQASARIRMQSPFYHCILVVTEADSLL